MLLKNLAFKVNDADFQSKMVEVTPVKVTKSY